MGFFRRLFRRKRPQTDTSPTVKENSSSRPKPSASRSSDTQGWAGLDANKHAIAVAAATAAVAEAALAAARAAAEVVRLTNGSAPRISRHVSLPMVAPATVSLHLAAVKIQSAFRRYLARRALRALKALVKLQALVRGHIVRKQSADMLRRMQTLVRVQTRARGASRSAMSETTRCSSKSSLFHHPLPEIPDKILYDRRAYSSKLEGPSVLQRCGSNSTARDAINLDKRQLASGWLDRWMEESAWDKRRDGSLRYEQVQDMKGDKILEVDTWKPHLVSQRRLLAFQTAQRVASDHYNPSFLTFDSPSKHSIKEPNPIPSQASVDAFSVLSSLKYPVGIDEAAFRTAESSPQAFSASSTRPGSSSSARGRLLMPARSECSRGLLNAYAGYPNYMANTESSRAKVRSQSAPRQRLEFEKYGLAKNSIHELWDTGTSSDTGFAQDADFRNQRLPA